MANTTKLKPRRVNSFNEPSEGKNLGYKNDDQFNWQDGGGGPSEGYIKYEDYEWNTLTGSSITIEDISNNITPSSDFTVSSGTVKPGMEYVLRVSSGSTPYEMTLGTGVTNPNGYKTELKPNTVSQFKFIATSENQLELEGVDSAVISEISWGEIGGTLSDQTDIQNEFDTKTDKVSSPTTDNLVSLTATGNIADSGIAKSNVELKTNKETGDAPTDTTSKYPSSHTVKKYVDDQVTAATAGAVSDTAYDATTWDGVTGIAPSKNAVRDKIVTMDSAISGNTSDISTINGKIPSEASTSNQLADKAFVGDSINSVTAYYITKNANGDQFATYAELAAATTFYSGGVVRIPTKNDYTIVLDDENHDHATTRYIYNNSWEYQYTINETPLTQAQLDALNSGITSGKVSTYDGYATSKQDKLVNQTNIKSINNNSLLGSGDITLNDVKVSATAPSSPTEGMVWYDTTNNVLKVYDGTNWNVTGKEYNAGEGISIGSVKSYAAMQGPCSAGYHIPSKNEWYNVKTIWEALGGGGSDGNNFGIALKLPYAGMRDFSDGNFNYQGSQGYYWAAERSDTEYAYCLSISSSTIAPGNGSYNANANSIRPFKDVPVVPTASWAKLYGTSIEAGGIFWSSTEGLISLSSDGQTWITIADKNLGATTVWNSGDTLSEANCGKYYQWGNNYGFDWAGTLSDFSPLQVDASAYGPGNYYSSSTYVFVNRNWDSSINYNLWGGTTGVIITDDVISNTGVLSVNGQTGNVTIESGGLQVAPNSPIAGIKYVWYGTESDYANLNQYYTDNPGDTEFHCF